MFFSSVHFANQGFEEKSMPEIQESSKTGDRFTAISDLLDNEEHVLFPAGNKQLS